MVVADIQMIALFNSAWERLSQTLPALHARRSWARVRAKAAHADAVVFLGDMLDDGRFVRDDDQYRDYAKNFQRLYAVPRGVNALYAVGNRDVGLGDSSAFSSRSRQRFVEAFGQNTNTVTSIGNHTVVLLDAPGLVDEDYHRFGAEVEFDDWPPTKGGAIEFVKRFSPKALDEPVVLFTHIPLARPDSASCGPLRERPGGIRRGVGPGYQNLIGKQTTSFVLEHLQPRLVLSADDMDYCEVNHTEGMREVTVKAFTLANGIRHTGFQLLTLSPTHGAQDAPCFMPDVHALYLRGYLPLFVLCIAASIWYAHLARRERTRGRTALPAPLWSSASTTTSFGETSPPHTPLTSNAFRAHSRSRPGTPSLQSSILLPADDDGEHLRPLPPPYSPSAPVSDATSFLPAPGARKVPLASSTPEYTRRLRMGVPFLSRAWRLLLSAHTGEKPTLVLGRRKPRGAGGAEQTWWRLLAGVVGPAAGLWILLALWTGW